MLLTAYVCEDCGKIALEPLRPNHMRSGALEFCGGKVRERRFAEVGVKPKSKVVTRA